MKNIPWLSKNPIKIRYYSLRGMNKPYNILLVEITKTLYPEIWAIQNMSSTIIAACVQRNSSLGPWLLILPIVCRNPSIWTLLSQTDYSFINFVVDMFPYKTTELFRQLETNSQLPKKLENISYFVLTFLSSPNNKSLHNAPSPETYPPAMPHLPDTPSS